MAKITHKYSESRIFHIIVKSNSKNIINININSISKNDLYN